MEQSVIQEPNIYIVPFYLYDRVIDKTNSRADIDANIAKLPRLDRLDMSFYNNFFLIQFLAKSLGVGYVPTIHERTYEDFTNDIFKEFKIEADRFLMESLSSIVSVEDIRNIVSSLFILNSDKGFSKIEDINMSLINIDSLSSFVTYETTVRNEIIIILHDGFLNFCLKSPIVVFLLLLEGLFNVIVKNYGEGTLTKSDLIANLRYKYLLLVHAFQTYDK